MNSLYQTLRDVFMYGTAIAAILAGFSIYQKWGRGEAIQPLIFTWLGGIVLSNLLFWAVDYFIVNNHLSASPTNLAQDLQLQIYQACLIMGVILSVLAIVNIYRKYMEGEELSGLLFTWAGSLIFLFSFGKIISVML